MSSYSKTFVFARPHEYDKSPFLKSYSLENVFKTFVFVAENAVTCGRELQTEKNLCFRNYPDTCGRDLSLIFWPYYVIVESVELSSPEKNRVLTGFEPVTSATN